MLLPERGNKQQQQQQLSQKASVDKGQAGSVHERERKKVAPNGTNHQRRSTSPLPTAPSVHPAALRRTRRRRRTTQAATWP